MVVAVSLYAACGGILVIMDFRVLTAYLLAEMMMAAAIDEGHAVGDLHTGCDADKPKTPHSWHSHSDDIFEPVTIVPAVPPFVTNLWSDEAAYQHHKIAMDTTHRNAALLNLPQLIR